MTLQQSIQRLISEKEITLSIISEKTGVTPRTVQNYVKGKTVPKTHEKYLTICEQIEELYETYPNKAPSKKYIMFRRFAKSNVPKQN